MNNEYWGEVQMRRRQFLQAGMAIPLILPAPPAGAQQKEAAAGGKIYVMIAGSWCGGWFWAPVAERLRAQGHRVFTPTLTGLGERRHLLSREVTMDTFILDVVNLIEAEELNDVVLVPHSSGGLPAIGVVDRIPERIRRVVFLDSNMAQSGQGFFDIVPPEVAAARRKQSQDTSGGISVPPPSPNVFPVIGLSPGPVADWLSRRMTPHPVGAYETPLKLSNPIGAGRPCTYVSFTAPALPLMEPSKRFAKGQAGWDWKELASGHTAPVTVPDQVAQLLMDVA